MHNKLTHGLVANGVNEGRNIGNLETVKNNTIYVNNVDNANMEQQKAVAIVSSDSSPSCLWVQQVEDHDTMVATGSLIGVQGENIELVHETVPDQHANNTTINTIAGVQLNAVQVDTRDTVDSGDLGSATGSNASSGDSFATVRSKKQEKKKKKGRRKKGT